jgi:sporulation protein YlmC with PRC-barrel domain
MLTALAAPPKGADSKVGHNPVIRARNIEGMVVKNPEGQELGKVEDVVVDMATGKVRYAAIAFGGFLGVGDKLFAVPFHSLRVEQARRLHQSRTARRPEGRRLHDRDLAVDDFRRNRRPLGRR